MTASAADFSIRSHHKHKGIIMAATDKWSWGNLNLVRQTDSGPAASLEAMGADGQTVASVAALLGVSIEEFNQGLDVDPDLREAWNRGRAVGLAMLMRGLHQAGRAGDTDAAAMWMQAQGGRSVW